jgi:hypothetical protein
MRYLYASEVVCRPGTLVGSAPLTGDALQPCRKWGSATGGWRQARVVLGDDAIKTSWAAALLPYASTPAGPAAILMRALLAVESVGAQAAYVLAVHFGRMQRLLEGVSSRWAVRAFMRRQSREFKVLTASRFLVCF